MNRRDLIRGIGKAICAGYTAPFIPSLLPKSAFADVVFNDPWLRMQQLLNEVKGKGFVPNEIVMGMSAYEALMCHHRAEMERRFGPRT